MKAYGATERVYVELEWCDGPIAGVADVNGAPHRFKRRFDEAADEYANLFHVWPIGDEPLRLEIEQWRLFVDWNALYEAGQAATDSHPGQGGIDARWDEITAVLEADREAVPADAKTALGQLVRIDRDRRYDASGPDYSMSWCLGCGD
jgi:hypothetical protein